MNKENSEVVLEGRGLTKRFPGVLANDTDAEADAARTVLDRWILSRVGGAVAEVTGASVENVKLAHKGETVIGEVMGDVAVAGYQGLSKFKGKKHKILSMAIMYPNLLQVVALKKSGITNIEQIKGKKISSGSPGSGTNFMAETVFKALGIPLDSYKDSRLSFTETANALRDGTIEVGVWSVGPGTMDDDGRVWQLARGPGEHRGPHRRTRRIPTRSRRGGRRCGGAGPAAQGTTISSGRPHLIPSRSRRGGSAARAHVVRVGAARP